MARNPVRTSTGVVRRERFSIIGFFGEVWAELRRTTWPTRQEATRLTMLVLALSITIGIFLGSIDWLFAQMFSALVGG